MLAIKVCFFALCVAVVSACEPKPLYGVTYAPLALNTSDICLPVEQVKKDMAIIATLAHSVRIYNIAVCYDNAVAIMESAKSYGMTVLLGLWMEGTDSTVFPKELDALPYFIENYEDIIEHVIVGNEPGFIEEIDVDAIIENYNKTKEVLKENNFTKGSSVAEVWPYLESTNGFKLVDALDFVCMNMQPYWEGFYTKCPDNETSCLDAGKYIHAKATGLENYFKKPVLLCEAGWPTDGERCCSGTRDNALSGFHAIPNLANATYFVEDFVATAKSRQRRYYVHTSFDEVWKQIWDPCDECKGTQVSKFSEDSCGSCIVDYTWGLYNFDRVRKENYQLPAPEAQCHFN